MASQDTMQESKVADEVVADVTQTVDETTEIPSEVPASDPADDNEDNEDTENEDNEDAENEDNEGNEDDEDNEPEPSGATEIVSPQPLRESVKNMKLVRVFLGGSISNGEAPNWQADAVKSLSNLPIYIFNPRLADWDPSASDEVKTEQIEWEFEAQANSDFIVYNFEPDFANPVTLFELGVFGGRRSSKVVVRCPATFPHYLNVKLVCKKMGVPVFETLDEALAKG